MAQPLINQSVLLAGQINYTLVVFSPFYNKWIKPDQNPDGPFDRQRSIRFASSSPEVSTASQLPTTHPTTPSYLKRNSAELINEHPYMAYMC